MGLSKKQILILGGGGALVLVLIILIFLNLRSSSPQSQAVTLTVWGFEDRNAFDAILQGYKTLRSNVTISYEKIEENNYESVLLNALASGQGPDVFMIRNRALPREKNKLAPAFPQTFTLLNLQEQFPQVVEQDFVSEGQVYALPLYLDTLALIYNKSVLDQAGIVAPPKTWDEFQKIIPSLRVLSPTGQVLKAGVAIGGSEKTVKNGVDIINLLMLQNGVKMTDDGNTAATFASRGSGLGGLGAFDFYLQFANAGSPYYTWNESQPNSLESFASGKAAMILGYQKNLTEMRNKNPFLKASIAPVPQPSGSETVVSYADYVGLAASKQSLASNWGWDFIIYATTNLDIQKAYLQTTGHPPALRSFIAEALSKPELGVFAKQALTARSWYQADDVKIKEILNSAILSVITGQAAPDKALRQAEDQVSQLMRRR
ncbi:MAG: extracellular solute-binding protein [Candidatus Liptonbacteria bacterium]|nr:extracellular solute-binding protein [Candidatus Liptonbacteria bacterium]